MASFYYNSHLRRRTQIALSKLKQFLFEQGCRDGNRGHVKNGCTLKCWKVSQVFLFFISETIKSCRTSHCSVPWGTVHFQCWDIFLTWPNVTFCHFITFITCIVDTEASLASDQLLTVVFSSLFFFFLKPRINRRQTETQE